MVAIAAVALGAAGLSAILPGSFDLSTLVVAGRPWSLTSAWLFGAAYVAASLLLLPTSPFAVAAGLVFGSYGVVIMWVGMMVASACSLVLSRLIFVARVRAWIAQRRRMRMVVDIVDEDGWRAVLLVRMSGILPFGIQNYALAVTKIGVWPYLLATAVGVIPTILLFTGAGVFGTNALSETNSASVFGLGLGALAAATLLIRTGSRLRRRLLDLPKDAPARLTHPVKAAAER